MMEARRVLLVLVPLLVAVERSEGVRCFAHFNTSSGGCDTEIGEVSEDECCQNPHYGYEAPDGECRFCGPPVSTPWSSWSPCNVPCGYGVRQRTRKCFGLSECETVKLQMEPCNGTCCDVQGNWSDWSSWGECSSSCIAQGQRPIKARQRVCSSPCVHDCQGDASQVEDCSHLPPCPVDGVWSEWSEWNVCKYPFGERNIRCKPIGGSQIRERGCLHRAHNGSICSGPLVEGRVCYNVDGCANLKGTWDGWKEWSLCTPPCGDKSRRFRRRHCKPDYSDYSPTIGRLGETATFFGTPIPDCGPLPDGESRFEIEPCLNAPPCS